MSFILLYGLRPLLQKYSSSCFQTWGFSSEEYFHVFPEFQELAYLERYTLLVSQDPIFMCSLFSEIGIVCFLIAPIITHCLVGENGVLL